MSCIVYDAAAVQDGFVSGGVVYLEKLLKLLKQAGMHAYLDMHALPGGAVKQMGYTGTHTMLYYCSQVFIYTMLYYGVCIQCYIRAVWLLYINMLWAYTH